MMKKILASFLMAMIPLVMSSTYAVEFIGTASIEFEQSFNDISFPPLMIKAESDGEINTKHGINIILPEGAAIQWQQQNNGKPIVVSGTGASKIKQPVEPIISENLYVMNIPVEEDFLKDDEIKLEGLTPITFQRQEGNRLLSIDINGDLIKDREDYFYFTVRNNERTDGISPDPVSEFKATYNRDFKQVELSWDNPNNFDFDVAIISRKIGLAEIEVYRGNGNTAIDKTPTEGEKVTYEIFVNDQAGNISEKVTLTFTVGEEEVVEEFESEVEEPEEVVEEPEEEIMEDIELDVSESEKDQLSRLFGYYNIRYQIKCLRAGADPLDSTCLWSRIDIIYAMEALGRSDVNATLTERELELMAKRIKYPEIRYQANCVDADEPADYCPALNDSINRVHYFIGKGWVSDSLEVSDPGFKLPFGVNQYQIEKFFKSGDRYFALVMEPSFNVDITLPSNFVVSFVGLIEATGTDTDPVWKKVVEVKNEDQNHKNNPYYLWEKDGFLHMSVVDVRGAGSGEGNMTVFQETDPGVWSKVGCYYFGENYVSGDYFAFSSQLDRQTKQDLSKCDVELRDPK